MFGNRGGRGGKTKVLGRSNKLQYGGQIASCQQIPPTSLAPPSNVYSNVSCDSNMIKTVIHNSDSLDALKKTVDKVVECLGKQHGSLEKQVRIAEELKNQTDSMNR